MFANAQLRASESILESVTGRADLNSPSIAVHNDFPEFKGWALSFVQNNEALDVSLPSLNYAGVTWNCSTLRRRLRIISGTVSTLNITTLGSTSTGTASASSHLVDRIRGPSTAAITSYPIGGQFHEPMDYFGDVPVEEDSSNSSTTPGPSTAISSAGSPRSKHPLQAMMTSSETALTSENLKARFGEPQSFDWTRLPMSAALPRHIQFAKSIDWSKTALGPMESWNFDLRAMCNLIMGSPHPCAMYWGPEMVTIYNEAYILLAGQKHPKLMGMRYEDAWREIWPEIEEVFVSAIQLGQATMKDDDCLFVRRNGFLEETYFSWSIIPLIGEDGSVVGTYNPAFDKTRRKITERRMLTLREVGEKTAAAKDVKSFWGQVIKGLEYNGKYSALSQFTLRE